MYSIYTHIQYVCTVSTDSTSRMYYTFIGTNSTGGHSLQTVQVGIHCKQYRWAFTTNSTGEHSLQTVQVGINYKQYR